MRRALPALFALAIALALTLPVTAAASTPKQMAAQIRTLQGQVKGLQKQVKKLNTALGQTEVVAAVALLYGGCATAATADAFQASNPTAFGTTAVTDYNACSDLQGIVKTSPAIARQPNVATVGVFQELLGLFKTG
jgi:hypothetical protein